VAGAILHVVSEVFTVLLQAARATFDLTAHLRAGLWREEQGSDTARHRTDQECDRH
jgi:hypothetical protein